HVPPQRDDELGLRLFDHQAIVGVWRAVVLTGPLRGDRGIRRVHPRAVDMLTLEKPKVVRRGSRVIVIDADDGITLGTPAAGLAGTLRHHGRPDLLPA